MKFADAPIQHKLMQAILLTCLLVLLFMSSAYMLLEYFSYRQILKTNVTTIGRIIASNSSASIAFDSPADATEILMALNAEKHIVVACLYTNSGQLFAKYPANTPGKVFPLVQNNYKYNFHKGFLEGFQPVFQKDKKLGTLYIKADMEAMFTQLRYYMLVAFLLIITSLVVAYILSKILQKSISDPIMALEQTAKIISEKHDYSVRARKHGEDEVGAFTDAFNHMLTQIDLQNQEILSFNQKLEHKVNERTNDLKMQKDFVEAIINSSVDIIGVFDLELNFIMLNKRAYDYYNVKEENLIGKNILEVFPQIRESGMYDDLCRTRKGEYIHVTKYKSLVLNRYFENFYIPLKDKNDDVYGILSIGHDIDDIIDATEKLEKANSELLKSNRDLEEFAYIASHDLQEPLRKIQTFAQLLAENLTDDVKVKNYQLKINQSATRMQQLIQDVLNFSRISNAEEAFVATDLNKIFENLKSDFELLIQEREVTITYPKLPVISGIPLQLTQLFSNLISNSIKYSKGKPVIDITVKGLTPDEVKRFKKLNNKTHYMHIQFSDNGIGFEPEFNEKIFGIFQRLHGKQTYNGTGIGLALCRKIVENHMGVIYAEGAPDKGATFNIILPEM